MEKKSNITLLVTIAILLVASIGALYGRKVFADQATSTGKGEQLEFQDTIDYLQPYLIAGGMDGAAAALSQFGLPVQNKALTALIQGAAADLSDEQKLELLGSMMLHNPTDQVKDMVMQLMYTYLAKFPVFSSLLPSYEKVVPMILAYTDQANKKEYKKELSHWIYRSAFDAIRRDEPNLLASLIALQIRPTKEQANKLLEKVVNEGRSVAFIPLLIDQLAGDPNYSPDNKRTLLMMAADKNNISLVKALLAQGADPEKIVDKAVGNARQVAFERGYAAIEILLQKKGKK